jgi:hypothetical protein
MADRDDSSPDPILPNWPPFSSAATAAIRAAIYELEATRLDAASRYLDTMAEAHDRLRNRMTAIAAGIDPRTPQDG